MSELELSNPAGRLHSFLLSVRQMADVRVDSPAMNIPGLPQGSALARLASIFHVEPTNLRVIFQRIGEVMKLPEEIRSAVTQNPAISNTFADVLPELEQYLRNLITSLANPGLQLPSDTLLLTLKLCSEQLAIHSPQFVPSLEDLASVRAEFEGLLADLPLLDIDDELRHFLMEQIANILYAIDGFTIAGVTPIRDSIANFIGQIQIQVNVGVNGRHSDESSTFGIKLWNAIDHLASLVSLTLTGTAIGPAVLNALTSGHIH